VADSIRKDAWDEMMNRLATITTANGYNYSPRICKTEDEAYNDTGAVSLWCVIGDEEPVEKLGIGGHVPLMLTLIVRAYIRKQASHDSLIVTQEKALQDVRNAVFASRANWRANADVTLEGLDTCETDEGSGAFKGLAFFSQPFGLTYVGGPTW
jgi:hypothetical protein